MSLNKTLDRLFDEIRREAKRNPEFAERMDAVMRAHTSRREMEDEAAEAETPPVSSASSLPSAAPVESESAGRTPAAQEAPDINPVGLYQREGEDALAAALASQEREVLLALVAEHNLDPGGEADDLDRDALAAHVVAQAKRRVERDRKLFDY